jgi:glycosyltransferase 2 family protein
VSEEPQVTVPQNPRRNLSRWIGLLVAGLLVWFVVRTVAWEDSLLLRVAEPVGEESYPGEIIGPWKAPVVRFRFAPTEDVMPILAAHPLAAVARAGGEVEVSDQGTLSTELEDGTRVELALDGECRPGMPRLFRELNMAAILPAAAILFLASLFIITRWWRLLLLAGCPTGWREAFRLTFVGLFFNTVLPGSTGGDLARAYVVVRGHPSRRADALTSVFADRALGLVGMALLSVIAIWTNDERFAPLRLWVLGALGVMVLGILALVNPFVRRLVRFDWWMERLPQAERLSKIDRAVRAHAEHPRVVGLAVLLSIGNHLCSTACCYWIGHAFGDTHSFHDYICVVTVANTVSALPLSPGGLGVGEVAFGTLLSLAGGLYMIGVATSFVYRLLLIGLGLGGGLVLLLPGGAQVRSGFAEARGAASSDSPDPPPT